MLESKRLLAWGAMIVSFVLVSVACGSSLDEQELRRAQLPLGESQSSVESFGGDGGGGSEPSLREDGERALGGGGGSRDSSDGSVGGGSGGEGGAGNVPSEAGGGSQQGGEGNGTSANKAPVILGSIGTQSGAVGFTLRQVPAAVDIWAADVNARGGLNGHPVKILHGDDRGDPGRAHRLARRMVEEQGAIGLFGTYGLTSMHSVVPYLEENRIPLIAGDRASAYYDYSEMVFNADGTASVAGTRAFLVSGAVQHPGNEFAFITCREIEYCEVVAQEVNDYAPVLGIDIVYEGRHSLVQPDYTAECQQAQSSGAEAVIFQADGPAMRRFAETCQRQGWDVPISTSWGQAFTDMEGIDSLEGMMGACIVPVYTDSKHMREYREARARWAPDAPMGCFGGTPWVGGKMLERAAEILGDEFLSDPPSSEDLIEAMYTFEEETLGGMLPPFTFQQGNSDRSGINKCMVLFEYQGGTFRSSYGDRWVCAEEEGLEWWPEPPGETPVGLR